MGAQKLSPPTSARTVDWEAYYWEWLPRVDNFFRYHTGDNPLTPYPLPDRAPTDGRADKS